MKGLQLFLRHINHFNVCVTTISRSLTKPIVIKKSCTTSVYATAYRPPNMVYDTAMAVETMMDTESVNPRITDNVDPKHKAKNISKLKYT